MAGSLWNDLKAAFPWIAQLGLSQAWVQSVIASAQSTAEITAEIRGTDQYKKRFPGIYREDGTQRMNEAEYLATEADYRRLLRQFGQNVTRDYGTPISLIGWFEGDVDPNELRDRLTIWQQVEGPEGQEFRDIFYTYTGKNLTNDELYQAGVDSAAAQNLSENFNRAAQSTLDFPTWIRRARQAGMGRVARQLTRLQAQGAVNGAVVQRILNTAPEFAERIMEAIYTNGTGDVAQQIPLQDLFQAFEFTVMGYAAQQAGLELPSKERLAEIRAAGTERARAVQAYREFGRDRGALAAAIMRARGVSFGREEFEEAEFLGDAEQARNLQAGLAFMESRGRDEGGFRFTEDRGRIAQTGFTNY